ncbi:MAG TPA: hypothetical protein VH393_13720 [Ktedonobacterales bacterium]
MTSSLLERVQEALERAASLPPEQQERVAADILSVIDNALWDAQLRDSANQAAHEALIAEALAEDEFAPFPTAEELGVEDPSDDVPDSAVADEQK